MKAEKELGDKDPRLRSGYFLRINSRPAEIEKIKTRAALARKLLQYREEDVREALRVFRCARSRRPVIGSPR